jgi:hypothetical protein
LVHGSEESRAALAEFVSSLHVVSAVAAPRALEAVDVSFDRNAYKVRALRRSSRLMQQHRSCS